MSDTHVCEKCGEAPDEWFVNGPKRYLCMPCKEAFSETELFAFFGIHEQTHDK